MNRKFKIFIFLSIFVCFLFSSNNVLAHPGRTDSRGCHTCRTNCSKWGLSIGEYHCHRSKGLPQPTAPIRSHYDESGGYTEPYPEYNNPATPKPTPRPTIIYTPTPKPTPKISIKPTPEIIYTPTPTNTPESTISDKTISDSQTQTKKSFWKSLGGFFKWLFGID